MLEKIKEKNVWDVLSLDKKPIVVYGMGDAAERIIRILNEKGIQISAIFASDEFVRGHSFLGYKVQKYSDICHSYDDFNVVLAFATHLPEVIEKIKEINKEHTVFAPDIPVAGSGLFTVEYIKQNEDKFDFVYNCLADEKSKETYVDILNFKVSGKIDYLLNSFYEKRSVYSDILKLGDNEVIVDLGAYDGDTIREITDYTNGKYDFIYALEPDEKNYKKLLKNTENFKNILCYNMGAWNCRDTLIFSKKAGRNSKLSAQGVPVKVTDLDSLIDRDVTMIKMDIEGAEMHALEGAENLIKSCRPKLYVCAYHRNEDLFSLALKILEMNSDYKIYFRHSRYIPAWESNFYCV
ncbi:MAG: FkbM family methyltransferase [Clostridiales bacterium]|nr:FkbM family methyltransferase [Clostridiales bacterium]